MSEKIILKNTNHKIKKIKINDVNIVYNQQEDQNYQQKQYEIELHNHFIKGFREGQKEAINRLEKEYSNKLAEAYSVLDSIYEKIDNQIINQLNKLNQLLIELSFLIAEKIVHREIEKDSPTLKIVDEALKKVSSANEVLIKINPSDFNIIDSNLSVLNKKLSSGNIKIEADERIEKGGCLIETEIGNSDGRISSQFEILRKQFESIIEQNNA